MSDMAWVLKWLSRAQADVLLARHVFDNFHPKQIEISCYQSQQAVEKALKAYLIFNDFDFPLIHDLRKLCLICADFDERFGDYLSDCAVLTPYATHARYPHDDEMLESDAEVAIQKAELIVSFCVDLIDPAKDEERA